MWIHIEDWEYKQLYKFWQLYLIYTETSNRTRTPSVFYYLRAREYRKEYFTTLARLRQEYLRRIFKTLLRDQERYIPSYSSNIRGAPHLIIKID